MIQEAARSHSNGQGFRDFWSSKLPDQGCGRICPNGSDLTRAKEESNPIHPEEEVEEEENNDRILSNDAVGGDAGGEMMGMQPVPKMGV